MSVKSLLQAILFLLILLILGAIYFIYFYSKPVNKNLNVNENINEINKKPLTQEVILEDLKISEDGKQDKIEDDNLIDKKNNDQINSKDTSSNSESIQIDKIENQISEGADFKNILENINVEVKEIIEYTPTSEAQTSESLIYQNKSSKLNLIENGDNFLLYNINKEYDKSPNLNDDKTKGELVELIYQKGKFDFNRKILEEIQNKEFNNSKFEDLGSNNLLNVEINTINDDSMFDINSIKMLYTLPVNSFTLINDKNNNIFLVKIADSKNNFLINLTRNMFNL